MAGILLRARSLRRDERGIVLIVFALMLVPMLMAVGVAIDVAQLLVAKRQLAAAVDAAALSVASLPGLAPAAAQQKAGDYLHAHFPQNAIGALSGFTAERRDNVVDISATAAIDTSFLGVAGYDTLTVQVNSRTLIQQRKLEVVMVLDNTGSMGETIGGVRKIDALKDAAATLVDTLFGPAESSQFVKIGLVPFANAVNVGSGQRGASWLDEAHPSTLNKEQVTGSGFTSLFQLFDTLRGQSWGGCVRARAAPFDLTDAASVSSNRATLFTPYFAPDELPDRPGVNYANDYLDGDDGQKYKTFTFYQGRRPSGGDPNYGCPSRRIQPLTGVKSTITAALAQMQPEGSTVIPEGLAWGWRVISPSAPFTEGTAYDAPETAKVMILLTDGRNEVGGGSNGVYKSVFTAYGYADNGHMGAADGSEAESRLNDKTAALCTSIKADPLPNREDDRPIALYTIVFGDPGATIRAIMRNCASGEANAFNSPGASDLRSAFESIGLALGKLRLVM